MSLGEICVLVTSQLGVFQMRLRTEFIASSLSLLVHLKFTVCSITLECRSVQLALFCSKVSVLLEMRPLEKFGCRNLAHLYSFLQLS